MEWHSYETRDIGLNTAIMAHVKKIKYHGVFENIIFDHQVADQRSVFLSHVVNVFLLAHANFTIATYGQTEVGSAIFHDVQVEKLSRSFRSKTFLGNLKGTAGQLLSQA